MPGKSALPASCPHADRFRALASSQLPLAEPLAIWSDPSGNLCLQTTWRLFRHETERWVRRQRLRLVVSAEALADYARSDAHAREAADRRFEHWLRDKLGAFRPAPGKLIGKSPAEEWLLTTRVLNA